VEGRRAIGRRGREGRRDVQHDQTKGRNADATLHSSVLHPIQTTSEGFESSTTRGCPRRCPPTRSYNLFVHPNKLERRRVRADLRLFFTLLPPPLLYFNSTLTWTPTAPTPSSHLPHHLATPRTAPPLAPPLPKLAFPPRTLPPTKSNFNSPSSHQPLLLSPRPTHPLKQHR